MLTKMPKVGDVIIANEKAVFEFGDLKIGGEYIVFRHGSSGYAVFQDDDGGGRYLDEDSFGFFTLKADVVNVEPVGFIRLIEVDAYQPGQTKRESVIYTDDAGLKTIKALVEKSESQSKRSDIQTQIDELQKELDAL